MKALATVGVACVLLSASSVATALEQPGGAPIPSDMGCDGGDPTGLAATFACECTSPGICNIGAACPGSADPNSCDNGQNGTCETTIWHDWNDNPCVPANLSGLDPWTDGATTPETFQPTCALTFKVVTRGTAKFKDIFGWYNVTGSKPTTDQLYPMLDCNAGTGTEVVLDVLSDPRYLGGEIGFFLATPENHSASGECAGGDCCATMGRIAGDSGYVYYSQRAYNPDEAGADSYIHLVLFDSRITEQKFYFAWEDIYGGSNNDFTDIVTSVSGVECSGGGARCDTGGNGRCAEGLAACRGGTLECVGLYDATDEECNAVDDDCDGLVDEDATCPDGEVCDHGRCLPSCELGGEFQCPPYAVCNHDTGRCIDPDCEGVSCDEGEVCVGGECVTECDGIVCPHGSVCRGGQCVDPCKHVQCAEGQVCREGVCFDGCTSCSGVTCTGGLVCDVQSGDCADPSCPQGCPEGTYCADGDCIDACDGAVCPDGQQCVNGECCRGDDCDDNPPGDPDAGIGGGGETPSGGCGCSGSGDPVGPIAILLAIAFALRQRRRRLS